MTALETARTIAIEVFEASGEPGLEEWRRAIGNSADDWYLENVTDDEVEAYALNIVDTANAREPM